jgi:hypothetical protein
MGILPLPQLSEEKPGEKIALDERCVGVGGTSIKGILSTLTKCAAGAWTQQEHLRASFLCECGSAANQ